MSGKEYMEQLDLLLRDIPHTERQEALKYYEDYFADAGEEHEAEVIEELGSPEELAKKLREDLKREENRQATVGEEQQEQASSNQESQEQSYQNPNYQNQNYQNYQNYQNQNYQSGSYEKSASPQGNKAGKGYKVLTICLIVLGILIGISFLVPAAVGIGRLIVSSINGSSENVENFDVETITADFDADKIRDLYIEAGLGALSIESWDGDTISVSYPKNFISTKQDGEELRLKTKEHWYFFWRNLFGGWQEESYSIVVKLPENMVFDEVDISAGAGTANIMYLETNNLYLETGAGELTAKELIVKEEVHIEAGVGETTIEKLQAGEADFSVGVGELNVSGKVNGDISADCGVGQMTLNLINAESDFNYNVSCGVGDVSINGKSYSGVGNSQDIDNNAAYDFDIDCGVGEIKIIFAATQAKN